MSTSGIRLFPVRRNGAVVVEKRAAPQNLASLSPSIRRAAKSLSSLKAWLAPAMLAAAAMSLCACAGGPAPQYGGRYAESGPPRPYSAVQRRPYREASPGFEEVGIASWYGAEYQNRPTADGELFDMNRPTAAHKTLPLPCMAEVTNLANGRTVVVRVNDRGPFVDGRVIDLSRAAAKELGFLSTGVTRVRVRYLGRAD
jgi:rare lipoprotein A